MFDDSARSFTKNRSQTLALVELLGLLLVFEFIAWQIASHWGHSLHDARRMAMSIFVILAFPAALVEWLLYAKQRGALLLDIGPNPKRRLIWPCAVIVLLIPLAAGFENFALSFRLVEISAGIFGFLFLAQYAAGRLQFFEGGIWTYGGLLPWSKIDSAHLTREGLSIRAHPRLALPRWAFLPLEADRVEDVKRLVDGHLGLRATSEDDVWVAES